MTRDGRVLLSARRIAPDYERSPPAHPRALDLRLLWPALVMWAVVAATLGTSIGARAALASVVIVVGVFTAYLGRPRHGRRSGVALLSAGVLLAVGMGLVASVAHESSRRAGPLTGWAQARGVVTVTGRVATEPILLTGFGSDRVLVRVHLDSAVGRGLRTRVSAPIFVTGDAAWRDLGCRQRAKLTGGPCWRSRTMSAGHYVTRSLASRKIPEGWSRPSSSVIPRRPPRASPKTCAPPD